METMLQSDHERAVQLRGVSVLAQQQEQAIQTLTDSQRELTNKLEEAERKVASANEAAWETKAQMEIAKGEAQGYQMQIHDKEQQLRRKDEDLNQKDQLYQRLQNTHNIAIDRLNQAEHQIREFLRAPLGDPQNPDLTPTIIEDLKGGLRSKKCRKRS